MRLTVLLACLLALALPELARAQAPALDAELTSCTTGVTSALRSATFTGAMPAMTGASVLAMRFDLEVRRDGAWKAVTARSFGRWERSVADAAGFVYEKRVEHLPAPATFRATVRYRWYDDGGRVVRETRRHTPSCRELERRPDLSPVTVVPGSARPDGATTYAVGVRNDGVTAARAFQVLLTVAGVALPPQDVPGLAAGSSTTVTVTGPACRPGDELRVGVDTGGSVDEADESDNGLVQRCV